MYEEPEAQTEKKETGDAEVRTSHTACHRALEEQQHIIFLLSLSLHYSM